MKKNLLSILILFLCLANFAMCAMMMFSQLSNTKKVNALIDKISTAISLEQNSGTATNAENIPIDETEVYQVKEGETITANLKDDGSGKTAYVVFSVSLTLNTNSDNYEKYSPTVLASSDDIISSDVIEIMGKYTYEEVNNNQDEIKSEILDTMQNLYGKDYVIQINFPSIMTSQS